ncbi:TPA: tannase/feruloyl esterase family alpha/beta hydrolase [Burkholderia cenocepacia]|nr:tannase/feruloyl esterase family alpha/beta hydrolase [Burkholderia cenocepacia]
MNSVVRFARARKCTLLLSILVVGTAALPGCAGDDDIATSASQALTCAQLASFKIPASAIGLPTTGAVVTAATLVSAAGSGSSAIGEYCKVSATIAPVDPTAPVIMMEVDLPQAWNQKVLMFGGGGYDGTIPATNGNVPAGPTDRLLPLGRGYVTFASDSGHRGTSQDGSFGGNAEAVANFSGDALKKTRDVAFAILKARYGVTGVSKAYFAGGSSGGREALAVIQRWPEDWDGAIVLFPAFAAASLDLQLGRISRAYAQPGAYLNPAKRKLLLDASLQACDALDGVADGIVSNVRACNASFDPTTATVNGAPLRCAGGVEGGDTCLSDAQIAALTVYNTPITFGYPLASGETQYPGFNLWGSDLGVSNSNPLQSTIQFLALNTTAPANPMPSTAPYFGVFWDQWVRFFVTGDLNFNSLSLDPQNPGIYQVRISTLAGLQDVNKADLTAFQAKGGKILMAHGMSDVLVSTRSTEQYFDRVKAVMGDAKVNSFFRYYEIAGYGHAASTMFNATWDSLTTLENWVEKGTVPPNQIVTDSVGVPGRTRPLCDYPAFPRYVGGDVNLAASFTCATQ